MLKPIHLTFKESKKLPIFRWFYYKEGFSPQLVWWAIEKFKPKKVYDPFLGSGTTVLASQIKNIESEGIDISPLSIFISEVKTRIYTDEFKKKVESIIKTLNPKKPHKQTWWMELFPPERAFPVKNLNTLLSLREQITYLKEEKEIKDFLLLGLVSIIPQTSYVIKDGGVLKINKNKKTLPAWQTFKRKIKRMLKDLNYYKERDARVYLSIKDAKKYTTEADMIITSPPYINNVDYTKVYGLELSFLGINPKEIRGNMLTSYIKTDVKGEGTIPLVNAYLTETKTVMEKLYESLKEGGKLIYVVSDAVIKETYIPIIENVKNIAKQIGFKNEKTITTLKRKTKIAGRFFLTKESALLFFK